MDRGWGIEPQPSDLLKLCFLQFNTIQSKLHHFEARDYQPAVNFSLAENIKLFQQLRNQMEISINLNRSCPAVSQIWSLVILSSICIRKAPNSTPTVTSYSSLNSFSVSLIKRELFPTPENLIVTSNAIFCIISIIYLNTWIKPSDMWKDFEPIQGWMRALTNQIVYLFDEQDNMVHWCKKRHLLQQQKNVTPQKSSHKSNLYHFYFNMMHFIFIFI